MKSCLVCFKEIPKGRKEFCSDECRVEQYKTTNANYGQTEELETYSTYTCSYDEYPVDQGILQLAEANELAFKWNQEALTRVGRATRGKERVGKQRKPRKNTLNGFS